MSKSQNLSISAFQEQFGSEEECYECLVTLYVIIVFTQVGKIWSNKASEIR